MLTQNYTHDPGNVHIEWNPRFITYSINLRQVTDFTFAILIVWLRVTHDDRPACLPVGFVWRNNFVCSLKLREIKPPILTYRALKAKGDKHTQDFKSKNNNYFKTSPTSFPKDLHFQDVCEYTYMYIYHISKSTSERVWVN